jgi:hypothetical protein
MEEKEEEDADYIHLVEDECYWRVCEHTNETLCSTKGCECIAQIRDSYLLKKRIVIDLSLRNALPFSQL